MNTATATLVVDRLVEIGFTGFRKPGPAARIFYETVKLCVDNEWILVARKFGPGEDDWALQAVKPKQK